MSSLILMGMPLEKENPGRQVALLAGAISKADKNLEYSAFGSEKEALAVAIIANRYRLSLHRARLIYSLMGCDAAGYDRGRRG